jgi:hypothetical protein
VVNTERYGCEELKVRADSKINVHVESKDIVYRKRGFEPRGWGGGGERWIEI